VKTIKYTDELIVEAGNYYENMPNETYHAHNSISKSGLDLINRDPFHFFNRKPMEQTRAMQVGSAIHAAILEPDVFKDEYMMLPEVANRQQPEYKKAVKAYGAGKVFTAADCDNIKNIQAAVWGNDEAKRLLKQNGFCELSGFAKDPVTGVVCRHRFDKLAVINGWAVDLKKTQDVRERDFARSIWNYRYHVQDAFYLDQYEWITGEKLKGMKFICVEEKWPHKVAVYQLDDISRMIGRDGIAHE
jgi:exodeoxyribonuclease VIII